jgi:hypothetical protein
MFPLSFGGALSDSHEAESQEKEEEKSKLIAAGATVAAAGAAVLATLGAALKVSGSLLSAKTVLRIILKQAVHSGLAEKTETASIYRSGSVALLTQQFKGNPLKTLKFITLCAGALGGTYILYKNRKIIRAKLLELKQTAEKAYEFFEVTIKNAQTISRDLYNSAIQHIQAVQNCVTACTQSIAGFPVKFQKAMANFTSILQNFQTLDVLKFVRLLFQKLGKSFLLAELVVRRNVPSTARSAASELWREGSPLQAGAALTLGAICRSGYRFVKGKCVRVTRRWPFSIAKSK